MERSEIYLYSVFLSTCQLQEDRSGASQYILKKGSVSSKTACVSPEKMLSAQIR
jgi:hypothetical protein